MAPCHLIFGEKDPELYHKSVYKAQKMRAISYKDKDYTMRET